MGKMQFGDGKSDLDALNEDLADFGIKSELELTGDKLDRGYLCGVTVLFYVRALASKDMTAAGNICEVLEALLADVTNEETYKTEIAKYEAEYRRASDKIDENLKDLEKRDRASIIKNWFTQSKFKSLVRLMARSGVYGKQLGGMAFSEPKKEG